jgi:hypothetical protein
VVDKYWSDDCDKRRGIKVLLASRPTLSFILSSRAEVFVMSEKLMDR